MQKEVEIKINTTADTKGAEDTKQALEKVKSAQKELSQSGSMETSSLDAYAARVDELERQLDDLSFAAQRYQEALNKASSAGDADAVARYQDRLASVKKEMADTNTEAEKLASEFKRVNETMAASSANAAPVINLEPEKVSAYTEEVNRLQGAMVTYSEALEQARQSGNTDEVQRYQKLLKSTERDLKALTNESHKFVTANNEGKNSVQGLKDALEKLDGELRRATEEYKKFQQAGDIAGVQRQAAVINTLTQKKALLTTNVNKLTVAMQRGANGMGNMGQAAMAFGYALDDLQYGFNGVVNNIPGLVMGLTGSMGIAAAFQIGAIAANQFINNMSKGGKEAKEFAKESQEASLAYANWANETTTQKALNEYLGVFNARVESLKSEREEIDRVIERYYRLERSRAELAGDDLRVREVDAMMMPDDTLPQKQKKTDELAKIWKERDQLDYEQVISGAEEVHDRALSAVAAVSDKEKELSNQLKGMEDGFKNASGGLGAEGFMKSLEELRYNQEHIKVIEKDLSRLETEKRFLESEGVNDGGIWGKIISDIEKSNVERKKYGEWAKDTEKKIEEVFGYLGDKFKETTYKLDDNGKVVGKASIDESVKNFLEVFSKKKSEVDDITKEVDTKLKELDKASEEVNQQKDDAKWKKENAEHVTESRVSNMREQNTKFADELELKNQLDDKQKQIDRQKEDIEFLKKSLKDAEAILKEKMGTYKTQAGELGKAGDRVTDSRLAQLLKNLPKITQDEKVDDTELSQLYSYLEFLKNDQSAKSKLGAQNSQMTSSLISNLISLSQNEQKTVASFTGQLQVFQKDVLHLQQSQKDLERKISNLRMVRR